MPTPIIPEMLEEDYHEKVMAIFLQDLTDSGCEVIQDGEDRFLVYPPKRQGHSDE